MTQCRSILGIGEREMAALLLPLHAPGLFPESPRSLADLFAHVAFSTLVEPGDTDAAVVVSILGAQQVLAWVAGVEDGAALRQRLRGAAPGEFVPSPERLEHALQRWRSRFASESPAKTFQRAAHLGARVVVPDAPLWPRGLDDLDLGGPLALWARGDPSRLTVLSRSISLVGARASSGYGTEIAVESAAGLSDRGFALVSGGALGIDAAVHRATLASDQVTVAFLAGGIDRLYPAANSELLGKIVSSGLVMAELPPGAAPTRWRFLMRNRLIAATSQATVVIEAGWRSGSLNTAGHAAQLGRPLGAVPGPVTSPGSAGCHRLIREYAATCVTSAEEMAELADPFRVDGRKAAADPMDDRVLAELSTRRTCNEVDLRAQTGLDSAGLSAVLGRLELAGLVVESSGGWKAR